jgi:hypothetical protein
MSAPSPSEDKRTLVDRALDRVRNNPFAAAIILMGIGLAALGSLTDSLKKLSAAMPEFSSPPEVIGVWRSEPIDLYGAGPQIMTMTITEVVSGRPVGFLRFADSQGRPATPELGIIQGKLAGNKLSFSYDGGVRRNLSSGGPSVPVQQSMSGEVSKKEIRFAYERDGSGTIFVIVRR